MIYCKKRHYTMPSLIQIAVSVAFEWGDDPRETSLPPHEAALPEATFVHLTNEMGLDEVKNVILKNAGIIDQTASCRLYWRRRSHIGSRRYNIASTCAWQTVADEFCNMSDPEIICEATLHRSQTALYTDRLISATCRRRAIATAAKAQFMPNSLDMPCQYSNDDIAPSSSETITLDTCSASSPASSFTSGDSSKAPGCHKTYTPPERRGRKLGKKDKGTRRRRADKTQK